MKHIVFLLLFGIIITSCENKKEVSSINPVNWESRYITYELSDSLIVGMTYLPVYSQIYSQNEHRTHNLTATISIRNTDRADTIFLHRAEYYNSNGVLVRTYFKQALFLLPMENIDIVIDKFDMEGGTAASFIFEWDIKPGSNEPLFEAVMISTSGQQGLSFITQGKKIRH